MEEKEYFEAKEETARIDKAIEEAEREVANGAKTISAEKAMEELNKKYYGENK